MDSSVQRKIILLNQRFLVSDKNNLVFPGGDLYKTSGPKPEWMLSASGNKNEVPLIADSKLKAIVTGANCHPKTVKELDSAVSLLYPGQDWSKTSPISNCDTLTTFDFGKYLGFSRSETRYILDYQYASYFPTYTAISYTKKEAEKFWRKAGGCYYLYRHDLNEAVDEKCYPNGILLRATLSVRSLVPHSTYNSVIDKQRGSRCIRVKLNIPSYMENELKLYQYDGLVGAKNSMRWRTWLFQGRFGDKYKDSEDLILMHTQNIDDKVTAGIMLNQNQDNNATPAVSNIVLIKVESHKTIEEEENVNTNGELYALSPDESDFMNDEVSIIDLHNKRNWTDNDQLAIAHLLKSATSGRPSSF